MHKSIPTRTKLPPLKALGFIAFSLLVAGFLSAAVPVDQQEIGGTCADCHEDVCADFKLVNHAGVETALWTPQAIKDETVCINCHGDPTQHYEEGGGPGTIFAFRKTDDVQAKTQKCLNCHSGSRARFFASPHGKAGMDCTNCHSEMMKATTKKISPTKVCISCHGDVYSQFQMNERHRLQEGILECTACHDQHAPAAHQRLGGFKHEACLDCHTDKGGPYVFEHGASRIEGCSACHVAHGSPNRHLLTHRSVPDLCFSCHVSAVSWHSRFTSEGTNCAVCHSTIHGSNLSRIFLK